jgi:integrase
MDNKFNFTKATLQNLPIASSNKRTYYYDTKIRGLALRVTSSNIKTFVVYRWVNGKPERVTLGRFPDLTIEQARKKATEVNAVIATGRNPKEEIKLTKKELTFGELFSYYLENFSKVHKPKTFKKEKQKYDRFLMKWKNYKLSEITTTKITELHAEIGKNNGRYEANRVLSLLSIVFNKAKEWGYYSKENPVKGIKKFEEQERERFLQPDELPRFFQALEEEPNLTIRDYVLISLLTGARRANVLAMQWKEISFERREWSLSETKNKKSQTIPLLEEAINLLTSRRTLVPKDNPYVFPSFGCTGHLAEPKRGWQRILDRANIKDLRLHDLRRTFGSWQARTGSSLTIIGKSLNHKSPISTAIYARLDLDPVRESMERATEAMLKAGKVSLKKQLNPS